MYKIVFIKLEYDDRLVNKPIENTIINAKISLTPSTLLK